MEKTWVFTIRRGKLSPRKKHKGIKQGDFVHIKSSKAFRVKVGRHNLTADDPNVFQNNIIDDSNPKAGPIIPDLGPLVKHNSQVKGWKKKMGYKLVLTSPRSPHKPGGSPPMIPPP